MLRHNTARAIAAYGKAMRDAICSVYEYNKLHLILIIFSDYISYYFSELPEAVSAAEVALVPADEEAVLLEFNVR